MSRSESVAPNTVLGEGTYGCVTNPSMTCAETKLNGSPIEYNNLISKMQEESEAALEMENYGKLAEIDPYFEFHLGTATVPFTCKIGDTESNRSNMKKCKITDHTSFAAANEKHRLVVMPNGGTTLERFANKTAGADNTDNERKNIERVWIEAQRLIRGMRFLDSYGYVHHDIKSANIVVDDDKNSATRFRFNFIDFGFMQTHEHVYQEAKHGNYWLADRAYSILPLEIKCLNRPFFELMTTTNTGLLRSMHIGAQKRLKAEATYIREVTGMLESIKRNLVRPSSRITATIHSKMISDFNKYKEVMVRLISHDTFMERVVRTIDMVGLGLALMNFLACSEHLMTHEMAKDIFDVLYKMMTPNLDERFTMAKVEIAYKEMLAKHKLLDKHGMTYSKRGYIVPVGTPEVEAVISPSLRGGRAPRRRRQSRRRSGIRRSRRKLRRSTRSAPT